MRETELDSAILRGKAEAENDVDIVVYVLTDLVFIKSSVVVLYLISGFTWHLTFTGSNYT